MITSHKAPTPRNIFDVGKFMILLIVSNFREVGKTIDPLKFVIRYKTAFSTNHRTCSVC